MKTTCFYPIILSLLVVTQVLVAQTPTKPGTSNLNNLIVSMTDRSPVVDGVIDANDPWDNEWIEIAKSKAGSITNEASAKFQLWGGADAFYLAVIVNDATPNNDLAISNSYERDCSEIFFSMDTNAYDNAGAYKQSTWQIRCQRDNEDGNFIDGNSHAYTWSVNNLTQSTAFRYASKSMPTEYVQEFIFPYTVLAEGVDWDEENFRFEIDIADNTTGAAGGRTQMLFWNEASDLQWKDTRSFGVARLVQVERPVAIASADQEVKEGEQVTLDGTASNDPGNQPLTYRWSAPKEITLIGGNTPTPSFIAPTVLTVTKFTIALIVNNGTADSKADEVVITVRPLNNIPVANAGLDVTVMAGFIVTLDGTASIFPQQLNPSYQWTAPSGIVLNTMYSAKPTFRAPKVTKTTKYTFKLVVKDGSNTSALDEVVVTVSENTNNTTDGLLVNTTNKVPLVDGIIDANDPWDDQWIAIAKTTAGATTNDASAKFQLWGGADAFYLAVMVNDTTPNNDVSISNTYERDCNEIFFSMDTNAYDNAGAYKQNSWQIRCQRESATGNLIDGSSGAEYYFGNPVTKSPNAKVASKSTATGYVQEFIFPFAALAKDYNWDGEFFRFEICNSDNTTGAAGGRTQLTFWNDASDNQWKDTRTFGVARLVQVERPVAKASADQEVKEGEQVTLDGTASNDPGNQPLTYRWSAPKEITLIGGNTATPSFIAPTVLTVTKFTIALIVNNGTADSKADEVVITVRPLNNTPVAQADFIKVITSDSIVQLNGQASYSPQGNNLNYQWTASEGIELSSATTDRPYFQVKEGVTDTLFTFTLVVNDGPYYSVPSTVTFSLSDLKLSSGVGISKSIDFTYQIYPNPTTGIVEIRTTQPVKTKMQISVTDLTGRKIFTDSYEPSQSYKLDLTGEAKGLYLIHLMAEGKLTIRKLVLK